MSTLSRSAQETKAFGGLLGKHLFHGDVVLLISNLGAGKTTLVQGLAESWNAAEEALSPTFVLVRTLRGKRCIHHLDFYRLKKKEILNIGVEDYLNGAGEIGPGLVLIEWADRCPELWPPERLEIRLSILPGSKNRLIAVRGVGRRYQNIAEKLKKR